MVYARSPFRDFESYMRIVSGLDKEDIQLILKQYISHFITNKISRSVFTIEDISEAVYTMGDHEVTLQTEYDDISIKSCLNLFWINIWFANV